MDTYQKISEARALLELPEAATMERIKSNYRALMKKWHPDTCSDKREMCEEMSRNITEAYDIIVDYCRQYEYSFTQEEVEKYLSEREWWKNRYGDDPIWG